MTHRKSPSEATFPRLSKRETEIMEIIYQRGSATAAEVRKALRQPPGYSSVRKQLELLEGKGLLRHTVEGRRYIYHARIPREEASRAVLGRVVKNFFQGDAKEAMVALLGLASETPSQEELEQILEDVEEARKGKAEG